MPDPYSHEVGIRRADEEGFLTTRGDKCDVELIGRWEKNLSKDGKHSAVYIPDTGYVFCCYVCYKRFGGPVYGEREITIIRCDKCKNKKTNAEMLAEGVSWRSQKKKMSDFPETLPSPP
jgi:hypothetical protein